MSLKTVIAASLCLLMAAATATADYNGTTKIYLVEPDSRWSFQSGGDIHQGLLDIIESGSLNLSSGQTTAGYHTWDASADAGYTGVTASNLEAIVVVFNANGYDQDAWPPYGYWFTAHDADASVAAQAGEPGEHQAGPGFTHTVFIEEGSATWCTNCPNVAADLHAIDQSGSYSFNYASLVAETPNETEPAYSRLLNDLNRPGYPCLYFDGGDTTVIGDPGQSAIENALSTAAGRTVPSLDMVVRMDNTGSDDNFALYYRIAFEADANQPAAIPDAPTGDVSGSSGEELSIQAVADDPEADSLFYQFNFDDGTDDTWYGPYASGTSADVMHSWADDGTYEVTVRTRDVWGATSGWSSSTSVQIGGGCCQVRGDANHNGAGPDVSDLVYLVTYMFSGGPLPPCMEEADINGNGAGPDVSDLVYLVTYMFSGGPLPAPCS